MNEGIIFAGDTVEEIAKAFSKIVSRNYLEHLQFWQATAMDDPKEFNQWKVRIETEPQKVERNAFEKILKILQEPQEHKHFFKKKWWFLRSRDVISITRTSGFYSDLLSGKEIEHAFAINVEYLIDKRQLTIKKEIYSQRIR